MFWEDISLALSGHDHLLQKHFPGWMLKPTTKEQVLEMVLSSDPSDFDYDDGSGVFMYNKDVNLRIVLNRESDEQGFDEPWVRTFPDPNAIKRSVYVQFGQTRVKGVTCAVVDGGRHIIPLPKSRRDLTIDRFQYHVGWHCESSRAEEVMDSTTRCSVPASLFKAARAKGWIDVAR